MKSTRNVSHVRQYVKPSKDVLLLRACVRLLEGGINKDGHPLTRDEYKEIIRKLRLTLKKEKRLWPAK